MSTKLVCNGLSGLSYGAVLGEAGAGTFSLSSVSCDVIHGSAGFHK